jgi:putative endonuclease
VKRKEKGNLGELLAQDFLKKKGYRILETNYRCPAGEIDIVARQGEYLVFIEVRTKTNRNFGSPEESITAAKMEHFERTVAQYQQAHSNLPALWRIDLVAVELEENAKLKRIEIIENAFE